MNPPPQRKSIAPIIILLILLVDVGLAVWWWNVHQSRQAPGYNSAGLNLAAAPPPPAPTPMRGPAAAGPGSPMADPSRNFIKDPDLAGPSSLPRPQPLPGAAQAPSGNAGGGAQSSELARPGTRYLVQAAGREYFKLKKNPSFKDSATIQAWIREFRNYPDLRALDDRYNKDKDGVKFLVYMIRSDNFKAMLDKYFQTPDVQSFMKTMSASPVVIAAAKSFMEDFNVPAAIRRYAVAGAPPQQPPPTGEQAVQNLKNSPALQKYLKPQESGVPVNQ
ncbi:MAG TPA: hypothetical protein VNI01_10810 [Elusimicrobiota bacterium]|nr:hypothetical protein [Elusimicrobiota bacterium]